MAGEMYFSGLSNTGFDYDAYLKKLSQLKSIPLQNLQAKQQQIIAKQTAIVQIKSVLTGFLSPLQTLQKESNYTSYTANVSNSDIAAVSVDPQNVQPGSYDLEVVQKAKAGSFLLSPGQKIASLDQTFDGSGTLSISYKIDGEDKELQIDYSGKSLSDIINEINEQGDIKATMINTGSSIDPDYKILLTSKKTGLDNEISAIHDSDGDDTQGFSEAASAISQQAQNAQIRLNGILIESPTDKFENVLDGVTIEAKDIGETGINITKDFSNIENALKSIVKTYNSLKDTIVQNTAKGQPLSGEASLNSITSTIFAKLSSLAKYGIFDTIGEGENATGKLKLNASKLNELLSSGDQAFKDDLMGISNQVEKYVGNYTDTMTMMNNRYTEQSRHIDEEVKAKSKAIQKEIEALRLRYTKIDLMIAKMKKTQLTIQNFVKSLNPDQNK